MAGIRTAMIRINLPARWGVLGAVLLGFVGAIGGLIIGMLAYAPTAWFAVIEAGLPAAVAGGTLGLLAGLLVEAARRVKHRYRASARTL
jgi:hypothetical protein